jgi:hypothetical protein
MTAAAGQRAVRPDRWEVGSERPWPAIPEPRRGPPRPWDGGVLAFSGRDAFRLLLLHGAATRGWRRLWVPTYYCQRVGASLVCDGLPVETYPDDPLRPAPELPDTRPGDVILTVDFFGMRPPADIRDRDGVEVIADHTHDPTAPAAISSPADFCVASLRKTLPLSDGAALWSPAGHCLPDPTALTIQRQRVAALRTEAMLLKSLFLAGHRLERATYRDRFERAEAGLDRPATCAMSALAATILASFPIEAWRAARVANHAVLRRHLREVPWLEVLAPRTLRDAPFGAVLVIEDHARRERVRRRLIDARVFPAVLWPLEHAVLAVREADRDLSRRILVLPCDARQTPGDMRRIADQVIRSGDGRAARR